MFTSKLDAEVQWDRWDLVALGLALLAVIWVLVLKLKTFYNLGYTSDLFVHVQLARGWLEGRGLLQTTALEINSRFTPTSCFCRLGL